MKYFALLPPGANGWISTGNDGKISAGDAEILFEGESGVQIDKKGFVYGAALKIRNPNIEIRSKLRDK